MLEVVVLLGAEAFDRLGVFKRLWSMLVMLVMCVVVVLVVCVCSWASARSSVVMIGRSYPAEPFPGGRRHTL